MDVDTVRPGFTYLLFKRVNHAKNEFRFYSLAWQPSWFDEGAVVRMFGREDDQWRTLNPLLYAALSDAWPLLRSLIRLRHGYRICEPAGLEQRLRQTHEEQPGASDGRAI